MALSRIDLVAGLGPDAAQEVLALGRTRRVRSGESLFTLGDVADAILVIERGRLALTMPIQVGDRQETVLVEERDAGETVGWSAMIPPHRFTLNAVAALDTDVLAIRRDALAAFFEVHTGTGYVVMRSLAEIMGRRLQVCQAMWLREMQRGIERRMPPTSGAA